MGPNAPIPIDLSLHIQLQQTTATAGCVDTDLPVGQCNYARSDKSVGEIARLHHAMWVDHTETCCNAHSDKPYSV